MNVGSLIFIKWLKLNTFHLLIKCLFNRPATCKRYFYPFHNENWYLNWCITFWINIFLILKETKIEKIKHNHRLIKIKGVKIKGIILKFIIFQLCISNWSNLKSFINSLLYYIKKINSIFVILNKNN